MRKIPNRRGVLHLASELRDRTHKLIRRYEVTDAAVHDSRKLNGLLHQGNTSHDVFGDSAYRSAANEASRLVRTIGIVRARIKIGLQNFVYNVRRLATQEVPRFSFNMVSRLVAA